MRMFVFIVLLLLLQLTPIECKTTIETYPQLELKENLPVRTKIFDFNKKNLVERRMKITLLNVNGFETNLFEINDNGNGNELIIRNEIDREEFLETKRCFDPMFCLFELHFLINDGEKYAVLPIHLVDENDNRPNFYSSQIDFRFNENVIDGYQMYLNGAKDIDEGRGENVRYYLSCSSISTWKNFVLKSKTKIFNDENCFGIFELNFIGKSSFFSSNQFDQLSIKYSRENYSKKKQFLTETKRKSNETEVNLIVFAFDRDETENELEKISSMKIRLSIVDEEKKTIERKHWKTVEENIFILWDEILEKSKLKNDENFVLFRSKFDLNLFPNLTTNFHLNSLNNEISIRKSFLFQLVDNFSSIDAKTFSFPTKNFSLSKISLFFREKRKFDEISLKIETNSTSNRLKIVSKFYPNDSFRLSLKTDFDGRIFLDEIRNEIFLRFRPPAKFNESKIRLNFRLENRHSADVFVEREIEWAFPPRRTFCNENGRSTIFQLDGRTIGELLHFQNVSNDDNEDFIEQIDENSVIYRRCWMKIDFVERLNETFYEFCLETTKNENECRKIQWKIVSKSTKKLILEENFYLFPLIIASTTLIFSLIFILICCSMRKSSICLRMKSYLVLGKKYQLSQIHRRSQMKPNVKIPSSIIVKDSSTEICQSSSISPLYFASSSFPMLFDQTNSNPTESNESPRSSTHFHLDVSRLASEV